MKYFVNKYFIKFGASKKKMIFGENENSSI